MMTSKVSNTRRLILNSKHLYLFQQQAFQLRNSFVDGAKVERQIVDKKEIIDDMDDNERFVLGYN